MIMITIKKTQSKIRTATERLCGLNSLNSGHHSYRYLTVLTLIVVAACCGRTCWAATAASRESPNILFAIADDWSWPHAGAYGDRVVETPTFDRLAREGVLFTHAFVSSPSCTPSRGAILTGQWHWRLKAAGNLWSVFPDQFVTYPELLQQAGYETGVMGKGWGPGRTQTPQREMEGKRYPTFQAFLQNRTDGKPFCFWIGGLDPHRPYDLDSGQRAGIDVDKIQPLGLLAECAGGAQ